ncbi:NADH:flavin oxidoreductase [Caldilinea sp.]|uniref:oxidoreductase n=1 Tax=Caldilinea sp. TaxID=2293560 RepID=UPI0021DCFAC1|nr:NADH:flavin oxidoreductase [Caldilinea sp.]GIV69218.1 MAG: NADH:flavin oxidoreductase [Caldilinea sp.]
MDRYKRVAQLRTAQDFRAYLEALGVDLPFDETVVAGPDAPLAQPIVYSERTIGNRFCVLPMEGWDGTYDGRPTELTERRWRHFGVSGAKLIWGCEAVAVRHDGRANPRQLMITADTWPDLARLREQLVAEHASRYGRTDDLLIGLQLTHSGRFARPEPDNKLRPAILYAHPLLNRKFGFPEDYPVLSDDDVRRLIDDFIAAARLAKRGGFDFVDLKHCHGYLGHEFLSAVDRNGRYGGSFENRTRFLRELVEGIRTEAPGLDIGVRVSAFDWAPFRPGPDGVGEMERIDGEYRYAFGGDGTGMGIDLREPCAFLDLLCRLNIRLVCITAGSPYYNPHIQRPALFPPSDGYQPPEDPLMGVARQIAVVARLKAYRPELLYVGSGYSYLQEWLPHVAQHVVRTGMADFVGLGRLILAYPEAPADMLAGRPLQRKRLCRTFSDCTTAPRNGMVSGCYPLDEFYKQREEAMHLQEIKARLK